VSIEKGTSTLYEAVEHSLHLTRAGGGKKEDELQPPAQVS
jgi:hypothetical protein